MYNIDTMKKVLNVEDLMKELEELKAQPNRDVNYRKDYDKLSKKIQYHSNETHRKEKNQKDLEKMRKKFKTAEYNDYMREYMRVYSHRNDNKPVDTPKDKPIIIF